MQLFLDTNIYLDFFRASGSEDAPDRLAPLRRLAELVSSGEVVLIVPEQVVNEYRRQRRKVAEETRELLIQMSKYAPSGHMVLGKKRREVKAVNRAIKDTKKAVKNLVEKYDEQIEEETTEADKLIKRLFKKAKKLPDSEEILERAHKRFLRGDPPRKSDYSYGDAIVWEILLEKGSDDGLTMITRDGDYTEPHKGKKALKSFLVSEWEAKTKQKVQYRETLGELINSLDRKETITKEVVEKERQGYVDIPEGMVFRGLGGSPVGVATMGRGTFISSASLPVSSFISTAAANPGGFVTYAPTAFYAGGGNSSVYGASGNVRFCPYCGTENPISNGGAFVVSKSCRSCGRTLD